MGIFGWSYPPGCSGTPADEPDPPCGICGGDPSCCACPECPACGTTGDPACESFHGLVIPQVQKDAGERARKELEQFIQREMEQAEYDRREAEAQVEKGIWD